MIKKQLSVAEVLSLLTGEEEYPSLSCSSCSEVGQEGYIWSYWAWKFLHKWMCNFFGEHSSLSAEDSSELDAIQNVNESRKENIVYEVLNSSSESEEEHESSGYDYSSGMECDDASSSVNISSREDSNASVSNMEGRNNSGEFSDVSMDSSDSATGEVLRQGAGRKGGRRGRGRSGRGKGRGQGRGRSDRGQGKGKSRGRHSSCKHGRSGNTSRAPNLPPDVKCITVKEPSFSPPLSDNFCPLHEPRPFLMELKTIIVINMSNISSVCSCDHLNINIMYILRRNIIIITAF